MPTINEDLIKLRDKKRHTESLVCFGNYCKSQGNTVEVSNVMTVLLQKINVVPQAGHRRAD